MPAPRRTFAPVAVRRTPAAGLAWRRGFSLVEAVAATAALVVLCTAVVYILSVAVASQTGATRARLVREALTGLVHTAATTPVADLVAGTFTVPDACPSSPTGPAGTSCVTAGGIDLVATWTVDVVDGLGDGGVDRVELTATTTAAGGVALTTTVNAPSAGFLDGYGLVRVTGDGGTLPADTAIYLVTTSAPYEMVASTAWRAGGATLRTPTGACTTSAPCVVSLSAAGPGGTTQDGTALFGPAATTGFTTTAGGVVPAPVRVAATAPVELFLAAVADSGQRAAPTVPGSVCVWFTVRDTTGEHVVPGCNDTVDDRIVLDRYRVDGVVTPVADGASVTVTTDHPDGGCPDAGGKVHTPSGWVDGAACTSWTWGRPGSLVAPDATTAFDGATLVAGDGPYVAQWAGPNARPATGYTHDPLWAAPRDSGACRIDASCDPAPATAPELDACPGQHCRSSADLAPLLWASSFPANPAAVSLDAATTEFALTLHSPDGDAATVTVTDAPAGLALAASGEPVLDETSLGTVADEAGITLRYSRPSGHARTTLTVTVDGASSPPRTQHIDLVTGNPVVALTASVAPGRQQATAPVTFTGTFADGSPAAGVPVTVDGPTGVTLPTTTLDSGGRATGALTIGGTARGTHAVTFTAGTASTTTELVVLATPSTVTVTVPADVEQGTEHDVTLAVTDAADEPAAGATVAVVAQRSGTTVTDVIATPYTCRTGQTGTCSVQLVVRPTAVTGPLSIVASTTGATGTATAVVRPRVARLTATPVTVAAGSSASATLAGFDSAGRPADGTVTVTYPTGLSGPATVTLTDGTATFDVAAANDAPSGPAQITATVHGTTRTVAVTVVAPVATLELADAIGAGTHGRVVVTARDAQGRPVAAAVVTVTAAGARVPASVTTGADGTATVYFTRTATSATLSVTSGTTATTRTVG